MTKVAKQPINNAIPSEWWPMLKSLMVINMAIVEEINPIPIKNLDAIFETENNRFKYGDRNAAEAPATKTLVLHDLHL